MKSHGSSLMDQIAFALFYLSLEKFQTGLLCISKRQLFSIYFGVTDKLHSFFLIFLIRIVHQIAMNKLYSPERLNQITTAIQKCLTTYKQKAQHLKKKQENQKKVIDIQKRQVVQIMQVVQNMSSPPRNFQYESKSVAQRCRKMQRLLCHTLPNSKLHVGIYGSSDSKLKESTHKLITITSLTLFLLKVNIQRCIYIYISRFRMKWLFKDVILPIVVCIDFPIDTSQQKTWIICFQIQTLYTKVS